MPNHQLSSLCLFKEIVSKATNTCNSMRINTCIYIIYCDSQIESIAIEIDHKH